ncbi:albusnodin family lasso peptide [Streptomyces kaniharaensis]|uniref:Albusnodin family lasso peptide n=1 Tax=Streptomyces kaniharaensis TaxID=212423 RepID=A0A6N7L0M7_9ACTN|nr:albusnodin family lasso peptide [Streptomyces kaniharaensis]MQS17402.1 albusnodin family lasso peptide [Streptomyces kaniharaensis]
MDGQTAHPTTTVSPQPEEELVELGGLVALTQGQGGGQSEDKRRAYNCA